MKRKKDLIMIVGAGIMQLKAIREAKMLGLTVLAVDKNPHAPGRAIATCFEEISTKDVPALIACGREYATKYNMRGVMTAGTDAAYIVATVAQALGLPGIPPEVALRATNKFIMRECLAAHNVRVPLFRQVHTINEALDAAEELEYPVVIKPVDNMGARGVRRIDSAKDLKVSFSAAIENSGFYQDPAVIVEEYMEGDEISMDTLVENGKVHVLTIADRHIAYPPYFVETGHSIPSRLSKSQIADAIDTMEQAIKAVGITTGAAKADIKITREGAKIGEITARLSGGFHSQYTEYLATGMNSTRSAVRLAIGESIDKADITPQWDRVALERAIIGKPGRIVSIAGIDEARDVTGVADVIVNLPEGSMVYPIRSNLGKIANIIVSGDTFVEAEEVVREALDLITITTEEREYSHS